MIIHLIRHTTPNVESGICYGQTDLDVVDSFADEALVVKDRLLESYDRVYSSPLQRCTKLADACLPGQATLDDRLKEFDFGDWELKKWRDIKGDAADAWFANFVELPCPNGESMAEMRIRVLDFYTELIEQDIERAAVFTHSGVQRIIHADILSTPLKHMFRLQLDFGAVIECQHNATHKSFTVRHL